MGRAYPPEAPVLWIKYGRSVIWNEVTAQATAHKELRGLQSQVKAPAVFYACEMELPRRNGSEVTQDRWRVVEGLEDPTRKDLIYSRIAFALSELHRIPVPQGSPPCAINGRRIRHSLFDEQECPRDYQSVAQLEDHLNLWLTITKRKHRVEGLSHEPIAFCYSDVWLGNFLIDEENHVTVIDFADCSILPSSFSKFVLSASQTKIKRDISELVILPTTDNIDNTLALCVAKAPMVMGPSSYATSGRRLLGNETEEKDDRIHVVVRDSQGSPITDVPRKVLKIPGYEESLCFVDLPPLGPPPPGP